MTLDRDSNTPAVGLLGDTLSISGAVGRSAGVGTWTPELEQAVKGAMGLGTDPGLGLLLELAKRGEYDPWDVDIVAVTDKYLDALDEQLNAQDLGRVARLIFYAAALIHLKSKALAERQRNLDYQDALEATLAEELDALDLPGTGGFPRLRPGDQPLDYGFLADPGAGVSGLVPRERPVRDRGLTLVDLISALRDYDERLAVREQMLLDEPVFDADMVMSECVGTSHQEDLDQDLIDVRMELWGRLDPTAEVAESVPLSELVTPKRSKSAAYLALLFLAQDEEILMQQDELYNAEVLVFPGPYFGEVRAGVVEKVSKDADQGQENEEIEQDEGKNDEGEDEGGEA